MCVWGEQLVQGASLVPVFVFGEKWMYATPPRRAQVMMCISIDACAADWTQESPGARRYSMLNINVRPASASATARAALCHAARRSPVFARGF